MDILLLGNGFDLHHKLPTTYLSFLKITNYLCSHNLYGSFTIGSIFQRVSKDYPFLKTCYEEYKSVYDSAYVKIEDVADITDKCENNDWWKYFNSIDRKDIGWIDFEKEISKVLNVFHSVLLRNKKRDRFYYKTPDERGIIENYKFIFEASQTTHKIKNKYLTNNPYEHLSLNINFDMIINDLFCSLKDFAEILKQYFIVFVDKPLEMMISKYLIQKNMIKQPDCKHVISFNYTKTYEELYAPANVHHIHGSLDQNIILGVSSDEHDIAESENPFISFKKYYQRITQKSDISYYELIQTIRMHKNHMSMQPINLTVIGHSLDSTDKDIITEIFSECDHITIYHHNQTALNNYLINLIKTYGKAGFDKLRAEKNLTFLQLDD